jgi:hypothetical protein
MNRYFRISGADLYEQVRLHLDAAWNHVPPETCVDPAAVAPRDSAGRILLAVRPEFLEFDAVASMMPDLLAGGAIEEIDESEYRASLPPSPV